MSLIKSLLGNLGIMPQENNVEIKKINKEQQIVYGGVHVPYMLDAHNDYFTEAEIASLAKSFNDLPEEDKLIDIMHNYKPTKVQILESYINKDENTVWQKGEWVLGIKILDSKVWGLVKAGKLNGYSVSLKGVRKKVLREVEFNTHNFSKTFESDGHTHYVFYELDKNTGKIINGRTNVVNNHYHTVQNGTATEVSDDHSHRYEFLI